MTDPLLDAVLGGVIGGLVSSPVFVYVGYRLSERAARKRKDEERADTQAKAALFVGLGLTFLKQTVEAFPSEPNQVTDPAKQLNADAIDGVFSFLSRDTILRQAMDLPLNLRFRWMDSWGAAREVGDLVKKVKARTDAITKTGDSWEDTPRRWETQDAADSEFLALYQALSKKRKDAIAALDSMLVELGPLVSPLALS